MNWCPDSATLLSELLLAGVLSPEEQTATAHVIAQGATVVSALRLAAREDVVWPYLAHKFQLGFYPDQETVRVMFTDLLNFHDVLATGMLPQRTRGTELHVMSYNPLIGVTTDARFPGWLIKSTLITPTLWRTLYEMGYPVNLTGKLSEAQATALVTHTVLGTSVSVTPDQNAEIKATARGYAFIDPTVNPPNPAVQGTINLSSKALNRCYPHHIEGNALIVMMADPDDDAALHQLQFQTRMRVIPAITTQANLDALIKTEEEALRAQFPPHEKAELEPA